MSQENVRLFFEALSKDKALQAGFAAVNQVYQGQKPTMTQKDQVIQQELIPLAKKAGFDFTLAELKDYISARQQAATHELSDDEIAVVSGGTCVNSGSSCTLPGTTCTTGGYYCIVM
jgi:hypothetical protein